MRYKGWGNQDEQWIGRGKLRETASELVDEYEALHPLPTHAAAAENVEDAEGQ